MKVSTIGLDIAKNVFQVHGEDAEGGAVQKRLRRKVMVEFFSELPLAWWRWKRAEPRTTGAARCALWDMRCG